MLKFLAAHRAFRALWFINLASSLAGWSLGIALSVHIYQLTSSPIWTAILAATPTASGIVFGHLAGKAADRWDTRRVVRITLATRMLLLPMLFGVAESAVGLACVVLVASAIQQFYGPAEQVLITTYVTTDDLAEANGLNSFASNTTRLVGPALGGFVMAWAGFRSMVIGMAVLMCICVLLSLRLQRAREMEVAADGTDEARLPDTYLDVLRSSARARGLVLIQIVDAAKEGPLTALFPVLMLGVIGATSKEMGLANSAFAVTAVIAGPLVGTVTRRLGYRIPVVFGAAVVNGLIVLLAIWPSVPMALAAFFLAGFPFTVSWVGGQTWLLLSVRHSVRGRVVGTTGAIYAGASLASTLAAGALAGPVGTRWVIGISAFLAVAALVVVDRLIKQGEDPVAPAGSRNLSGADPEPPGARPGESQ